MLGIAPVQPQESGEDFVGAKGGSGETEGPILHGGGPEGLQDPEGLALGLAPAEDLVQGPTGPEGPTPGYKFYWPEVVVVGGTGTVSSCTGVFMV